MQDNSYNRIPSYYPRTLTDAERSSYIGPQTMAELKQALAERDAGITAAMSPVGAEVFNFGVMMMKEFKK